MREKNTRSHSPPRALAREQPLIVSTKKINPKLFSYANEASGVQVEE